jgi:hypothetical protein
MKNTTYLSQRIVRRFVSKQLCVLTDISSVHAAPAAHKAANPAKK